jgi:hypothetical protein
MNRNCYTYAFFAVTSNLLSEVLKLSTELTSYWHFLLPLKTRSTWGEEHNILGESFASDASKLH